MMSSARFEIDELCNLPAPAVRTMADHLFIRAIQSTCRVTELRLVCNCHSLEFSFIGIYQRSNSTLQHETAEVGEYYLSGSIRQMFDREHRYP
jgi:hypothetical protein